MMISNSLFCIYIYKAVILFHRSPKKSNFSFVLLNMRYTSLIITALALLNFSQAAPATVSDNALNAASATLADRNIRLRNSVQMRKRFYKRKEAEGRRGGRGGRGGGAGGGGQGGRGGEGAGVVSDVIGLIDGVAGN